MRLLSRPTYLKSNASGQKFLALALTLADRWHLLPTVYNLCVISDRVNFRLWRHSSRHVSFARRSKPQRRLFWLCIYNSKVRLPEADKLYIATCIFINSNPHPNPILSSEKMWRLSQRVQFWTRPTKPSDYRTFELSSCPLFRSLLLN